MEELVNFIERVPKAQSASLWKNKDIQRWAEGGLLHLTVVGAGEGLSKQSQVLLFSA